MSHYNIYLDEIENRKKLGLSPKPVDSADLATEIISHIKDVKNKYRKDLKTH